MNIEDMTIAEVRRLAADLAAFLPATATAPKSDPYPRGPVIIRTVTMHYVGRLVEVSEHELVIEEASWVADSGRWSDALKTGTLSEVEPYPDGRVVIGRGALVDCAAWAHDIPRTVK